MTIYTITPNKAVELERLQSRLAQKRAKRDFWWSIRTSIKNGIGVLFYAGIFAAMMTIGAIWHW